MNVQARYNRQSLIEGWNQELWAGQQALVVGDNLLAHHIVDCLVATGVGSVKIVGNRFGGMSNSPFVAADKSDDYIVKKIEKSFKSINPFVNTEGIVWNTRGKLISMFAQDSTMVFDASNDPITKERLIAYCLKNDKFLVSASAGQESGAMAVFSKNIKFTSIDSLLSYTEEEPSPAHALVFSGFMVDEARKHFMRYKDFEPEVYQNVFIYNLCSRNRFSATNDFTLSKKSYGKEKILIGGAGALGMPVATGLIGENPKLMGILDYDVVEDTNIGRQTLYADSIGKRKSDTLRKKVLEMNPDMKVDSLYAKIVVDDKEIDENSAAQHYARIAAKDLADNFTIFLRCFDNFTATALLNRMRKPLIYAGTNYHGAIVTSYIPSVTSCLDCTVQAAELSRDEPDRDSCNNVPEPSIITSGKVAAGLMLGELAVYIRADPKEMINGRIVYESFDPARMGVVERANVCNCGDTNDK